MGGKGKEPLTLDRVSPEEGPITRLVPDIAASIHVEQYGAQPAARSKNRLGDYHAPVGFQHSGHLAEAVRNQLVVHVMHDADEHGQIERTLRERHPARVHGIEVSVRRPAGCSFYIARFGVYTDIVIYPHIYDAARTRAGGTSDVNNALSALSEDIGKLIENGGVVVAQSLLQLEDQRVFKQSVKKGLDDRDHFNPRIVPPFHYFGGTFTARSTIKVGRILTSS